MPELPSDSLADRLHFAWTLARRQPARFLLLASHRAWRAASRRLRPAPDYEWARRLFHTRYAPAAAEPAALRAALARVLPAACLERENYLRLWGSQREAVLAQAERVFQHRFDLLGSGETDLGVAIDWHRDFKSGRRWPLEPARCLPLIYPDDSDIKVIWELSRFQHLPLLGKAYWLTGEERWAEEFAGQLADWREKNPPGQGPNWMVAMEAAIRAVNWIYAANFFVTAPSLGADFWQRWLEWLFLHGAFIRANLEWNPYARGNHYLANLVGLIYLGAFFADSREGQRWLAFASRALAAELDHQVDADGVAHEASTGYHRLVSELFLAGGLVAARQTASGEVPRAGLANLLGERRARKLEAMFEFILTYTRPDGWSPVVGDSDDGRLVSLAGYGTAHPADHRHLLAAAALVYEREDFRQAAGEQWEEAWWLLGSPPPAVPFTTPGAGVASRAFPAGSFFLMRSADAYVFICCGDVGLNGVGAHAHCDQLSFELALGRQPLVVDPGSYVYTADLLERFRFRSTASHNTVRVEGAEQNRLTLAGCFRLPDDARARVRHWQSTPERDEFEGEHLGYARLPAGVLHRRAFWLEKAEPALYVLDRLSGRGEVGLEWFFHLAPGVGAQPRMLPPRPGLVRLVERVPRGCELMAVYSLGRRSPAEGRTLVPLFVFAPVRLASEVGEAWASDRYGVRERISVLRFHARLRLPVQVLFVFDLGSLG